MRLRSLISVTALAAAASFGSQVQAATTTCNVTLTIDAVLAINWCDSAGANDSVAAQTWAMGTGVALNTIYHTVAATPATAGSTLKATIPTLRFIENNSNCTVNIAVVSSNSTNWSVAAAAAANAFKMEANYGGAGYATIHTSVANFIANLDHHAASTVRSSEIGLQITTPTSITIGGGRSQTITVTFTASAAP